MKKLALLTSFVSFCAALNVFGLTSFSMYTASVVNTSSTTNTSPPEIRQIPHISAPVTASDLAAQGRALLSAGDRQGAYNKFVAALALDPSNQTANSLAGVLRVVLFIQQPATQAFLDRLGVSPEGRDLFNWTADFTRDTNGMILLPNDFNAQEFVQFLRLEFLPRIGASITNFSKITTTFRLDLSAAETGVTNVTVDYGDVQILRAMLNIPLFLGNTLTAYNLNVQLGQIMDLRDGGNLTYQNVLLSYPDLLTLSDKARLAAAKAALKEAIARYFAASSFIRARPFGSQRLFMLTSDESRNNEAQFRDALTKANQILNGPFRPKPNAGTLNVSAFFSGTKSLRDLLPQFEGNLYVANTLPDPTFGGIFMGSQHDKNKIETKLREHFGYVERDELIRPTIKITSPKPNQRVSASPFVVSGTAMDNQGLDHVEIQVNGGPFQTASGTTTWLASANLVIGTNVLRARSFDINGNVSALTSVTLVLLSPLNLEKIGFGKITGATNGQFFEVGKMVTLTATPDKNNLFAYWSGDTNSYNTMLRFVMQPNMTLTATFLTNVFVTGKGNYNGLFKGVAGVTPTNSGLAKFMLTDKGSFSGTLTVAGTPVPITGQFVAINEEEKMAQVNVRRPQLQINLSYATNHIDGFLSGSNFPLAHLTADLAATFPPPKPGVPKNPLIGSYTTSLSVAGDPAQIPVGCGGIAATITPAGVATFSGTLSDGSLFSQTVNLSVNSEVPICQFYFKGKGLLIGTLKFNGASAPSVAIEGSTEWIKLPVAKTIYPDGFDLTNAISGYRYIAPLGTTNVLSWTNGSFLASSGNINGQLSNAVQVVKNIVTVVGTNSNKLTFNIVKSTGLFNGHFLHPNTGKVVNFQGALLQPDVGCGAFLGTNQSGLIRFEKRD